MTTAQPSTISNRKLMSPSFVGISENSTFSSLPLMHLGQLCLCVVHVPNYQFVKLMKSDVPRCLTLCRMCQQVNVHFVGYCPITLRSIFQLKSFNKIEKNIVKCRSFNNKQVYCRRVAHTQRQTVNVAIELEKKVEDDGNKLIEALNENLTKDDFDYDYNDKDFDQDYDDCKSFLMQFSCD